MITNLRKVTSLWEFVTSCNEFHPLGLRRQGGGHEKNSEQGTEVVAQWAMPCGGLNVPVCKVDFHKMIPKAPSVFRITEEHFTFFADSHVM
jgi:hypothetical protein